MFLCNLNCRYLSARFQFLLLFAWVLCAPLKASASGADSFKTKEYWNSTGLDFIRAADAYALGYTGAGITLGIIDTPVLFSHTELAGKRAGEYMGMNPRTGQPYIPVWERDMHGSHVAGIMVALRDGIAIHGVAFDASLVSVAYLGSEKNRSINLLLPNLLEYFASRPEIRIINNSWGRRYYPSIWDGYDDPAQVLTELREKPSVFGCVAELVLEYNKVAVFAAGNDTQIAPSIDGVLPRYIPTLKAWVSVISLDTGQIETALDGTRIISPFGVSSFSNLASTAQLWSISAPGSDIGSLDASDGGYALMGGTSMAAPYVSGALGLVQQAFPWMTGKQLADAVLTTADHEFKAPDFIIQYISDNEGTPLKIIVTTVDGASNPSDSQIKAEIDRAYAADAGMKDSLNALVKTDTLAFQPLTREEIFGRGLLDVGKAVRGIALLDANRMTADDVATLTELGLGKQALETFDTQGYTAEFSNDIAQRKWADIYHHADFKSTAGAADALALEGLNVGLRKTGAGLLVLSGTNSYEGATVVDGGGLAVSKRPDGTGGILQKSSVLVRQGGTLLGDGEIQQRVVNSGTVAPGYRGLTLTVEDYVQNADGTLLIGITADKLHSFLTANSADLKGALRFSSTPGFYANGYGISVNSVQATSLIGDFDSVGMASASPTLGFNIASSSTVGAASVTQHRAYNAYSRYADSATTSSMGRALYPVSEQATGDMQNLFQALDWSDPSGRGVAPAMEQLSSSSYDAVARAGLEAQRQLNLLLVQRFLGDSALLSATRGSGVSSGDAASGWQAWALPFGSYSNMNANNGSAGFTASGAGLALGVDRQWDSGLAAGFDAALSGRRAYMHYAGEANAKTLAASVGGHVHFKPNWWDGGYVMGMARVGFEDVSMKRTVNFNGYLRNHDSRWTGLTTDVLAGGGKDWGWTTAWGGVEAGPLAWLEYSLSSRPGFTEGGAGASALKLDPAAYDSLSSVLGAHVNLARTLENGTTLSWNTLAGWLAARLA